MVSSLFLLLGYERSLAMERLRYDDNSSDLTGKV